jgi:two-component system cell cycle sensor histidine kinase/response regulator CckA
LSVMTDITEETSLTEELNDTKTKYKAIVEDSSFLFCRFDLKGKITFANSSFCSLFNIHELSSTSYNFYDLIGSAAEDRKRFIKMLDKHKTTDEIEQHIKVNGNEFWIAWTDKLITNNNGDIIEIQTVGKNNTESHKLEMLIQKSRIKYQTLVDNMTDGVFIMENGRVAFCNASLASSIGYHPADLIDKPLSAFIAPKDLSMVLDYHRRRLARDPTVPSEYVLHAMHRDGIQERSFTIKASLVEVPKLDEYDMAYRLKGKPGMMSTIRTNSTELIQAVIGTARDITAEEARERMLSIMTQALDYASDRIMIVDNLANIILSLA